MTTRRALLASAAIAPLLTAGLRAAQAQVESPAEVLEGTPVATPASSVTPDLTGVTPLPLTDELLATFEAYVATALAEAEVPGAAVAVVQNGEVAFLQGFGVREMGHPAPVTADTLLRIGSVTKSFSSMLTATLVDAGRLTWETPLVDLLPDFAVADPTLTARLTVRDAFCACSGLPRRDLEFMFRGNDLTPELMIAEMVDLSLTAPYGEKYQYSNQMVGAGGFAAAVADGGSPTDLSNAYDIALRERVLNPIGMPQTTDVLGDVVAGNGYAVPHGADVTGALHPMPLLEDDAWLVSVAPSGALWSSATEMARYVQTELSGGISPDGVRVVSAENLEYTWQPGVALHIPPEAPRDIAAFAGHYGLGWVVGAYRGQRAIWHSGGTLGFTSLVTFLPEADLGIVVLTNSVGSAAGPLTYAVTFRLFELLFDQPAAFDAEQAPGLAAAAQAQADFLTHLGQVDPATVTPYLGQYANPALGPVRLALRDGALFFDAGQFLSELRPLLNDDGTVAGYVPLDPPLGGFPPSITLTLEHASNERPTIVLTAPVDPGEADLVYTFDVVGTTATPTP
jgi:CubicO group peptidase (beta-lactamase class C family)